MTETDWTEPVTVQCTQFPFSNPCMAYEALYGAYIGNHQWAKDRQENRAEKLAVIKVMQANITE